MKRVLLSCREARQEDSLTVRKGMDNYILTNIMTQQRKIPIVNFHDNCVTLENLLDRLQIPDYLKYKGECLKEFCGLTKKQLKARLRNTLLVQEGISTGFDRQDIGYQVYANAKSLYICLFTADGLCCEVYHIPDWMNINMKRLMGQN